MSDPGTGLIVHARADALRTVADLIESGLPTPITVTLTSGVGVPTVTLSAAHVPAWVSKLGLPTPRWQPSADFTGWLFARWEPDAFDGQPFTLLSCRLAVEPPVVHETVDQLDPRCHPTPAHAAKALCNCWHGSGHTTSLRS